VVQRKKLAKVVARRVARSGILCYAALSERKKEAMSAALIASLAFWGGYVILILYELRLEPFPRIPLFYMNSAF
jgi:hypothetical protein